LPRPSHARGEGPQKAGLIQLPDFAGLNALGGLTQLQSLDLFRTLPG
jgi:hypothetical protein